MQRATPAELDRVALWNDLIDLLNATGTIALDDYAKAFSEVVADGPSTTQIARCLRALAIARTTILPKQDANKAAAICKAVQLKLHTRLRLRYGDRAKGLTVTYDEATRRVSVTGFDDDPVPVHQAAAALSNLVELTTRRGPKVRSRLDSLLFGLAQIFADMTGNDATELPVGDRTHFILFAHLALMPILKNSEADANPLSQRWEKLKAASRQEFHPGV
ncbi:MAG: hypothetical protein AB7G25_04180 [Sphingomonadaceae bacterium]